MTYIVGHKCYGSVILAADTAVTTGLPVAIEHTTFGQSEYGDGAKWVYEGGLKILAFESAAVAMCGNLMTARQFAQQFHLHSSYLPAESAIHEAIEDLRPFDTSKEFSAFIAAKGSDGARLWVFDSRDGTLHECQENEAAWRGSLSKRWADIPTRWLSDGGKEIPAAKRRLVNLLAFLHSMIVYRDFLQQSVGGAFCGLVVSSTSIDWQPDTCYLLVDGELRATGPTSLQHSIVCISRDNVFCADARSPDMTKAMADSTTTLIDPAAWQDRIRAELSLVRGTGTFDYIVFISTNGNRSIVVLEMGGKLKTNYVEIEGVRDEHDRPTFGKIRLNPRVANTLLEPRDPLSKKVVFKLVDYALTED